MASNGIAIGRLASLGALLAILVAGCGGGGSEASPPAGASTASRSTPSRSARAGASQRHDPKVKAHKKKRARAAGQGHEASEPPEPPSTVIPTPVPAPTAAQRARADVADVALEVPGRKAGVGKVISLPSRYTCRGVDESPPLRWRGVPAGTKELILFAMNLRPAEGRLFFDWAVAGIDPKLESLSPGSLPPGAIPGRASTGKRSYSMCPSGKETVAFALYAVPKQLGAKPGFEPAALRERAMNASHNVGLLPTTAIGK